MEGPEYYIQSKGTVRPVSAADETEFSGGGGEVGHHQGLQRLLAPPGDGDLLQIPDVGDVGSGRRLAGGVEELVPGKEV